MSSTPIKSISLSLACVAALSLSGCGMILGLEDPVLREGPLPEVTSLEIPRSEITPAFDPAVLSYDIVVPLGAKTTTITLGVDSRLEVTVGGTPYIAGQPLTLNLVPGENSANVEVRSGEESATYELRVHRGLREVAKLNAPDATAFTYFGEIIAVDGNHIAVGLPGGNKAYVYTREANGNWNPNAVIITGPTPGISFGQAVALRGNRLAVGAPSFDADGGGSGSSHGRVFLYDFNGINWVPNGFVAITPVTNARLGSSLQFNGGLIVVGAPNEAPGGAVYVTDIAGNITTRYQNSAVSDNFGRSIGMRGNTLVVGAYQYNNGMVSAGRAYVYRHPNNSPAAMLDPFEPSASELFAFSVGITDEHIVVGVPFDDSDSSAGQTPANNNLDSSGGAYVYAYSASSINRIAFIKAHSPGQGEYFGWQVSAGGDFFTLSAQYEDGSATTINGPDDDAADSAGAGYLFGLNAAGTLGERFYVKGSSVESGDAFAWTTATDGSTLVVGAVYDGGPENAITYAGAIYVYE